MPSATPPLTDVPLPDLPALRAALRRTPGDVPLWLALRAALVSTDSLGAVAATQRAFDERERQLRLEHSAAPEKSVRRALRNEGLLPIRAQLAEDLIRAGYPTEAVYHLRWLSAEAVTALPNAAELPRLRRWLSERLHAHVHGADPRDSALAPRLALIAARLLVEEPLAEWPATVVEYLNTTMRYLLLPPHAVASPADRLLPVSGAIFPSLLALPPGAPVQVRVAPATQGSRPEVFALANRPNGDVWELVGDARQAIVLYHLRPTALPAPADARVTDDTSDEATDDNENAPFPPGVVLILPGDRRVVAFASMFSRAGLPLPVPGDCLLIRCLLPPVTENPRVLELAPDPTPDPNFWRTFSGRLYQVGPEFAYVDDLVFVHRSLLPPTAVWAEGTLISGVAALLHDHARTRLTWRAVRATIEPE